MKIIDGSWCENLDIRGHLKIFAFVTVEKTNESKNNVILLYPPFHPKEQDKVLGAFAWRIE